MLVHMQAALLPPRTAIGVYAVDMALVVECPRRVVAVAESELLLQAQAAAVAAAQHKTVFVVCPESDVDHMRHWPSLHCGLLSCTSARIAGVCLGVAIGPAASRIMWAAASAKCTQRAASMSRGTASTRMYLDDVSVYGASVLQCLLQYAAPESGVKRVWR